VIYNGQPFHCYNAVLIWSVW